MDLNNRKIDNHPPPQTTDPHQHFATKTLKFWLGKNNALMCVARTLLSALEWSKRLELFRSTSVPVLTRSTISDSLQAPLCGSWNFCAVCSDALSL